MPALGPLRAAACALRGPLRPSPGLARGDLVGSGLARGNLLWGNLLRGHLVWGHLVWGHLVWGHLVCGDLLGRGVPRGIAAVGRNDADLGPPGGGSGEGA